jgi:hypothetical protein
MQEVPLTSLLCKSDTNSMAKFFSILLFLQLILYSCLLAVDFIECRHQRLHEVSRPSAVGCTDSHVTQAPTTDEDALVDTDEEETVSEFTQVDNTHPYLDNLANITLIRPSDDRSAPQSPR